MSYLTIIIALGIVLLFGFWSGSRRTKSQTSQKPKLARVYPLTKSKSQSKLRRVK